MPNCGSVAGVREQGRLSYVVYTPCACALWSCDSFGVTSHWAGIHKAVSSSVQIFELIRLAQRLLKIIMFNVSLTSVLIKIIFIYTELIKMIKVKPPIT
jgi:hypothetical protein